MKSKLKKLSIYDIKRLSAEKSPYFFTRKTLKFFKQKMSDFKVIRLDEEGLYYIYAQHQHGKTERYFDPVTNELRMKRFTDES